MFQLTLVMPVTLCGSFAYIKETTNYQIPLFGSFSWKLKISIHLTFANIMVIIHYLSSFLDLHQKIADYQSHPLGLHSGNYRYQALMASTM